MSVQVVRGDLLKQDDVDAIVNTVNCVGVMGKGIALQFKNKWPNNFKRYAAACKANEVRTGKMFVFDAGAYARPNFIINFPTKDHWRGNSKIEFIRDGLVDLIAQIKLLNIRSIAIPPLGCGNGGLNWSDVRPLIVAAFAELPDVDVRLFEPSGAPDPKTMEVNTKKPRMTLARAAIVKALDAYAHVGYGLSKLEVQKLVYFMQLIGVSFPRIHFGKEKYGPYSETLRHALANMEGHFIQGLGDGVVEAEIGPTPTAQLEATSFLERELEGHVVICAVERVADLIDGYQSAYGMELLATVHWVATNEPFAQSPDAALLAIRDWSERKADLMQPAHVSAAWQRLTSQGWISSNA
jgi:O-acetyl-ADP-ribose deacetylase (regulator of RNase III)